MSISELHCIEVTQDPKSRKYNNGYQDFNVFLGTLTFMEPWNAETAEETIKEFVKAIDDIPEDGILFPIIDTKGLDLKFNVPLFSLIPLQDRIGTQIIVAAGNMVRVLGDVFRSTSKSDLRFVNTLDEALAIRESILAELKQS